MSLFRKPKKIQRRVFCADDDDEEPEPPPPPVISYEKKEKKPIKTTTLLSFADEEEEGEVFKVKKSTQSKRLAKRREKEKRRAPDGDNNKYDNCDIEDNEKSNNVESEEKPKHKKKVTLEGLILSGREALAADGTGDVSDDSIHEEEEDSRGFHQYRAESVRAALAVAPGHIPDAALIHAARKTRQQARELGDFVPLQKEAPPGSRLIRDDGSGDDEDEGRLHVRGLDLPSDKPKRGTAAAASDEELDSEAEEWVEQQMQKVMPAIADIAGEGVGGELNPFAAPPPPPRLLAAPHLRALGGGRAPASAPDLVHALTHRLEELQMERDKINARRSETHARLLEAARVRAERQQRARPLAAAYRRAQAARGYLTDLVECLDEKMPQLETLEARALALHRRRCEFLVERRRADVRDQAQDVLAKPVRAGAARPPDPEEKVRRAAEREGRRRARRLLRPAAAHRDGDSTDDELPPAERRHHQHETETIRQLSSALFADALPAWRGVRGVCARLARVRRRARALYCDAYVAHYLPQLLAPYVRHQLILWNPLADEDNEDYEKMDWYKCLMMYGVQSERLSSESESSDEEDEELQKNEGGLTESSVREDPDLYLVPIIINKLVLPKLTELVEHAWDPMCVRACVRLRTLLLRAAALPSPASASAPADTPAPAAPLRRLAAAVRAKLAAALNADVFLPTLPPNAMEGPGGAFWRRCVGAGVRLQRGALALAGPPATLCADPLVLALIDTLCTGAGAAAGAGGAGARAAADAAAALADSLPRAGPLRAAALRRLAGLARLAHGRLDNDNPINIKALEQVRAIIAEARAVE